MGKNPMFSGPAVGALRRRAARVLLVPILWWCMPSAAAAPAPLIGASPLLGRPTASSITLNIAAAEEPLVGHVSYREAGRGEKAGWLKSGDFRIGANSTAEVALAPLSPDTRYEYRIHARRQGTGEADVVAADSFQTQKLRPGDFSFALASDSHITPFHGERLRVLAGASAAIRERKPEFLILLGDNIQTFTSHGGPLGDSTQGPQLYRLLRRGLGTLPGSVPVFTANGNWEGENGWHPPEARGWARAARTAHFPNPGPDTYPQGGSREEDYYAFTWGEALFIVLNATGYTGTPHTLNSPLGRRDDWTLGDRQLSWLHDQLAGSQARWKLLFVHHPAGGNGGDEVNSRYGRGGGRAAATGEQATIHGWMRRFGAQALFYGHDHVFTDIVADGIHYVCVGSAGAPWKFGTAETGYETFWTPSGFTWVEVSRDSLRVSFVGTGEGTLRGRTLHSFVIER